MTTVETVLGPVATAELGPTLMHEPEDGGPLQLQPRHPHDRRSDDRGSRPGHRPRRRCRAPLARPRDCRHRGLGASAPQRYFSAHGVDAAADLFIRDITQGIGTSGVKAAIIKCATDTAGVTR